MRVPELRTSRYAVCASRPQARRPARPAGACGHPPARTSHVRVRTCASGYAYMRACAHARTYTHTCIQSIAHVYLTHTQTHADMHAHDTERRVLKYHTHTNTHTRTRRRVLHVVCGARAACVTSCMYSSKEGLGSAEVLALVAGLEESSTGMSGVPSIVLITRSVSDQHQFPTRDGMLTLEFITRSLRQTYQIAPLVTASAVIDAPGGLCHSLV